MKWLAKCCSEAEVLMLCFIRERGAQDAAPQRHEMIQMAWVLPSSASVPASSFPLHSSLPVEEPAKTWPLLPVVRFEHVESPGWFVGVIKMSSSTGEGGTQPFKLWWDGSLARAGSTEPTDDQNAPFLSINSPLPSWIAKTSNNSKYSVIVSNQMTATISQWCYDGFSGNCTSKSGYRNIPEAVTLNRCIWLLRFPLFPTESGLLNKLQNQVKERLGYSSVKCQSKPGLRKGLRLREL